MTSLLKKTDLARFKQRLEEMKAQILHTIQGTSQDVKEADGARGYSQHAADEGTDDFGKVISLELTSKEMTILRQIERALEKIEDGTYGVCDFTGEPIPLARLEAIPYATLTVQAQEKMERGEL